MCSSIYILSFSPPFASFSPSSLPLPSLTPSLPLSLPFSLPLSLPASLPSPPPPSLPLTHSPSILPSSLRERKALLERMATQVLLESRDQQASLENLESQDPRELRWVNNMHAFCIQWALYDTTRL